MPRRAATYSTHKDCLLGKVSHGVCLVRLWAVSVEKGEKTKKRSIWSHWKGSWEQGRGDGGKEPWATQIVQVKRQGRRSCWGQLLQVYRGTNWEKESLLHTVAFLTSNFSLVAWWICENHWQWSSYRVSWETLTALCSAVRNSFTFIPLTENVRMLLQLYILLCLNAFYYLVKLLMLTARSSEKQLSLRAFPGMAGGLVGHRTQELCPASQLASFGRISAHRPPS